MSPLRPAVLPFVLAVSSLLAPARAQDGAMAVFRDPAFQKAFVGGYGVASDVEPRLGEDDVAVLEKVMPLMAQDLEKAAAELQKHIAPDCSAVLDFTLGGIRFQQERLPEAKEANERAVAKFPNYRRAHRNLGLLHARLGEHEQTIRAFTRTIELGGADAYAYGLLGFAHFARQDFQPAEAAFRSALLLQPENAQWRIGLAQCVLKQRKFEDAAALLDMLIAREPARAEYWLLQAHAFLGMQQPLRAAANLEVLGQLGKATVDSTFTLGDVYASVYLPDLAARAYERAFDLDPKQPVARAVRAAEGLAGRGAAAAAGGYVGHVRATAGEGLAEADRRKLLKLEARFRMAEGHDGADDAKVLEEIVALDPLDGEALLMLGRHFAKAGEPEKAVLWFERAEGLEAFEAEAKIRHAQVLAGQGRYADALPLLRRAQQIKPRDEVARYLEQVERMVRTAR